MSVALEINDARQIIGQVDGDEVGEGEAVVWDLSATPAGTQVGLGFLAGSTWSRGFSINNEVVPLVVGESDQEGECPTFTSGTEAYTTSFRMRYTIPLPAKQIIPPLATDDDQGSFARDVSTPTSGEPDVVGYSWSQSVFAELPCQSVDPCGDDIDEQDAATWAGLTGIMLAGHSAFQAAQGWGINDLGHAVGWSKTQESQVPSCFIDAVFWEIATPTTFVNLGAAMPVGQSGNQSQAWAVNNGNATHGRLQIVGIDATAIEAMLWERSSGGVWSGYNLNDLLPACAEDIRLFDAHDISDAGLIVAWGDPDADDGTLEQHVYLLVPAELPCPADITGATPCVPDGTVDSLDFLELIAEWGSPCNSSTCGCAADITGPSPLVPDGNVDALDFLMLISQWAPEGDCDCIIAYNQTEQTQSGGGGGAESDGPVPSGLPGGLSADEWTTVIMSAGSMGSPCWIDHYAAACGSNCTFHDCDSEDPLSRH